MRFLKVHMIAVIGVLGAGALASATYMLGRRSRSGPIAASPADHAERAPDEHAGHTSGSADEHAGHGSNLPPGYVPMLLDASQATALGLTSESVVERDFTRKVRTVGVVAVDETRTSHVHTRVRGWIEAFHVNFVGRKVRRGEPLVSLYSQEVYAAQLEFASLLKSPVRSPELVDAGRRRLALWDVPGGVIAKVEETGDPQRTFPVLAPRSGVVVAKQAFEGVFVDPSIELYTISDLSRVWVLADVYEADVADVRVDTPAQLAIEGESTPIEAKVAFLYPTVDERTRTRKARFELANPNGKLLPGAFATIELELGVGRGIAVPESAVIRTGKRSIVFLVHGEHIQPREVTLGPLVGDHYRVERGLVAGDRVATGAQFLLDSESRLRATSGAGGGHAGH